MLRFATGKRRSVGRCRGLSRVGLWEIKFLQLLESSWRKSKVSTGKAKDFMVSAVKSFVFFAQSKLFCWCWTDILLSSQRFLLFCLWWFLKNVQKWLWFHMERQGVMTYMSNLSPCFCQGYMRHKQDWQRSVALMRKKEVRCELCNAAEPPSGEP